MVYYPGTGRPSGFHESATFYARVRPGTTYTFSAYMDGTGYIGVPPYVILSSVDGDWAGVSTYQSGKGKASIAFTIPSTSHTTFIRGAFGTENGTYPIGRGAAFSQPQVEVGDRTHPYVESNDEVWHEGPEHGNLVVNSEPGENARYWTLAGGMIVRPDPNGSSAIVYMGNGRPSGFDNYATFLARVEPGSMYTFSCYLDGAASVGTPLFAILSPVNGSWQGAHVYQSGRGRVFTTFTIPMASRTTLIRGAFNPENGKYAMGSQAILARPQLERGELPAAYRRSSDTMLLAPPGGNLIPDSEARRKPFWTLAGRMRQLPNAEPDGAADLVFRGTGEPSGFGDYASVRAEVVPGRTYTLTSDIDGSASRGTPPYVFVTALNGTWPGAHAYQTGRGLSMLTFTIPPHSSTTCVDISFTVQNGAYPIGTSLVIARPQLAPGAEIYRYAPSPASTGTLPRCV